MISRQSQHGWSLYVPKSPSFAKRLHVLVARRVWAPKWIVWAPDSSIVFLKQPVLSMTFNAMQVL